MSVLLLGIGAHCMCWAPHKVRGMKGFSILKKVQLNIVQLGSVDVRSHC